jgi:hypothetical protein
VDPNKTLLAIEFLITACFGLPFHNVGAPTEFGQVLSEILLAGVLDHV